MSAVIDVTITGKSPEDGRLYRGLELKNCMTNDQTTDKSAAVHLGNHELREKNIGFGDG